MVTTLRKCSICKAVSTWSSFDDRRRRAFTHRKWEKMDDYILGPKMFLSLTYVHNKVKLCCTWDHYPVYSTMQEDNGQGYFNQKKKGWAGLEAV